MLWKERNCQKEQLGFYLKSLDAIISKLWSFVLAAKFFKFTWLWGINPLDR